MELDRVERFISTTLESIGMNLEAIQEALAMSDGTSPSQDGSKGPRTEQRSWLLEDIRRKCNELCQETVHIEAFSLQNAAAFARLAKHYDQWLGADAEDGTSDRTKGHCPNGAGHPDGTADRSASEPEDASLMPLFLDWFEKEFVQSVVFDRIVVMLSDIFAELREAEEEQAEGRKQRWIPGLGAPRVLREKTTKYWVHPKHVLRVKLLIIKHLPVLIFGSNRARRTASCTDSRLSFFYKDKLHDSQDISSIYFDNQGLEVYRRRLVREDMASLHRVRCSNAVRISLDTDLRMVDERAANVADGDWCRDLSCPIYESESVLFPYAILEIKLQMEERPEWIEELLATGMLLTIDEMAMSNDSSGYEHRSSTWT
eukprot:jgi/Pico_ML_1/51514/g2535.t2